MSARERPLVLAIDDDLGWLSLLGSALQDDLEIRLCPDPLAAATLAAGLRPQLILLDLGLPGGDGERLLVTLLQAAPEAAVVVLSAREQVDSVVRCMQAGARDYLAKTLPKDRLLARIREHARRGTAPAAAKDPDTGRIHRVVSACSRLPAQRQVYGIVIDEALRRCGGNCSAAARMLDLTPQAVSAYVRKRRRSGGAAP